MVDLKIDLRQELLGRVKREFIDALERDEQAAVEAAIGDMGNKPDAVKLGWLRMRTKESWTKLNSALLTRTTYQDEKVESGRKYYYYLTAVDQAGNVSDPSEVVSETVP